MLRVKLERLAGWIEARRRIAACYRERGSPACRSRSPSSGPDAHHVYSLFTVRHPRREAFVQALADLGVGTAVHYPLAIPDQPMFADHAGRRRRDALAGERAARPARSSRCPATPSLRDDEIDHGDPARSTRPAVGPAPSGQHARTSSGRRSVWPSPVVRE